MSPTEIAKLAITGLFFAIGCYYAFLIIRTITTAIRDLEVRVNVYLSSDAFELHHHKYEDKIDEPEPERVKPPTIHLSDATIKLRRETLKGETLGKNKT